MTSLAVAPTPCANVEPEQVRIDAGIAKSIGSHTGLGLPVTRPLWTTIPLSMDCTERAVLLIQGESKNDVYGHKATFGRF